MNKETAKNQSCLINCMAILILQIIICGVYYMSSYASTCVGATTYNPSNSPYPDVIPLTIIMMIINLIIQPLTLAYSRCKE